MNGLSMVLILSLLASNARNLHEALLIVATTCAFGAIMEALKLL